MKIRLVGWQVQPVVMADDGENLTPLQVTPQMIAAKDWQAFKEGGDEAALAQMRARVEAGDGESTQEEETE